MDKSCLKKLNDICNRFNSPEDINDGAQTAPSKRILELFPQYDKPLYGALVATSLGVERLKQTCPHFGAWVAWLESLGAAKIY